MLGMSSKWTNLKPERIADISFAAYEKLPKSGKPIVHKEWTVLSCILLYKLNTDHLEVVSLGTGTKCLGADGLKSNGSILNDSHAEIMARRGFLKYIYSEMLQTKLNNNSSIFIFDLTQKRFRINETLSFHFFTTHSPCGDASIFTAGTTKLEDESEEPLTKKLKQMTSDDSDNVGSMTGAKLINSSDSNDLMEQTTEAIRTKPGRGIRTLSVSCSDKFLRWNIVGIQGALLDSLLDQPIYLDTITICGHCDVIALERAIWKRCSLNITENKHHERFTIHQPSIRKITNENYQFIHRQQNSLQPTAASIVWCKCNCDGSSSSSLMGKNILKSLEVSVNGIRQGITKNKLNTSAAQMQICKIELFKLYLNILKDFYEYKFAGLTLTYKRAKENSEEYTKYWNKLRINLFVDWTKKPEGLNDFCCTDDNVENK